LSDCLWPIAFAILRAGPRDSEQFKGKSGQRVHRSESRRNFARVDPDYRNKRALGTRAGKSEIFGKAIATIKAPEYSLRLSRQSDRGSQRNGWGTHGRIRRSPRYCVSAGFEDQSHLEGGK